MEQFQGKFKNFLFQLGFSPEEIKTSLSGDMFVYRKQLRPEHQDQLYEHELCVKYIYISAKDLEQKLFEKHADIWNENNEHAFIAISEQTTYLINAKVKPNPDSPIHKNNTIESFAYGVNSEGFATDELAKLKDRLGKESIDSTYFFDFIIEKAKKQKTSEVDKDLLLNLIQLRNDLLKIRDAQETIHLLILRCLFIKYLEDRGIYEKDYLLNILKTGSSQELIDAFEQIKRINGDIFKYDEFSVSDIDRTYLNKLERFFSSFDYRSGQGNLFPYKFDKIPIQLISHVYEAFLSNARKGNKGIYYTPTFVVKFMLAHTVQPKLQEKKELTVLDPACGSGAFLVEAFKEIVKARQAEYNYEKKVNILEKQLFGIDVDKQALQIATFSLYLALLEGETAENIREKIRNAYPILPSLINHTLIQGNSLMDDIYHGVTFDCIVANPPWGSVPTEKEGDEEDKRERKVIAEKGKIGSLKKNDEITSFPVYKNVSDYQRSQAFLLKITTWCHQKTLCALIANNSIFLNENAEDFRKELLHRYRVIYFYELSHLNKILFRKRVVGKIKINGETENIEIGATEPCAIIILDKKDVCSHIIQYISPKLTQFSETFELIHYTQKDIKTVKQEDLEKEDYWLWRIFVNGCWADYQLIKRKYVEKSALEIECASGFQPSKSQPNEKTVIERELIIPSDFERFFIKKTLRLFNWNRNFRRDPEVKNPDLFKGKRILVPMRPLKSDTLRLRGVRVDGDIIHKHNVLSIKIKKNNILIEDYASYLAILNSSFFGYYLYHISSQWGKGEKKRDALRNSDIEKLPLPEINPSDDRIQTLTTLVEQIETHKKEGKDTQFLEHRIDELVFDLCDLLEFEKEMIREFYQVNVEREGDIITPDDLQNYVDKFRNVFSFILADPLVLNASYRISSNLGAYISFTIIPQANMIPEVKKDTTEDQQLLNIVKKQQLSQTLFSHRINEDKVKIYTDNTFFIIKSNYFKDWTIKQAMIDANEEIGLIVKELPKK